MSEYPYSFAASRLKEFLEDVPSTGMPDKMTIKELEKRGFKSSNDRSILSILKFIGLIDESGVPVQSWVAFKQRATNRSVLASLLRSAYADLFKQYPDAQARGDGELRDFMSASKPAAGERTIQAMVATFKALCSMADWPAQGEDAEPLTPAAASQAETRETSPASTSRAPATVASVSAQHAPVSVSVQIQLPPSATGEQIDALMQSIARHLLGRGADTAEQSEPQAR